MSRPSAGLVLGVRLTLALWLGVGVSLLWLTYRKAAASNRVIPGVTVNGRAAGGQPINQARLAQQAAEASLLDQEVTLRHPRGTLKSNWHALGVVPESATLWPRLARLGRSGGFFRRLLTWQRARAGKLRFDSGYSLDPARSAAALRAFKEQVDSRARSARLDLANRRIVAGTVGYELDVYASQARLLAALRLGQRELTLAVTEIRPKISSVALRKMSIRTVMGRYETPYNTARKWRNRTFNLRVAARKLNGTILMPDEEFDFNISLGARNRQEGYRIAPVIARGELVDGIAGGVCQISSTLFAAAFFAGLDILKADVHSMPSHYIGLGLDATVVWPTTTMKLRNPFDHPVVIHYEVNSGRVVAEILGSARRYKIGFERRIIADRAFKEQIRPDEKLKKGERKVKQRGQRGYTVRRRRIFFDREGHEVRSQYWTVVYPPSTMIIHVGTKESLEPAATGDASNVEPPKPINPVPDPATFRRIIQ